MVIYPLVNLQKAMENTHLVRWFTHQKWWFSISRSPNWVWLKTGHGIADSCEMSLHNDIPRPCRPYRMTASCVYFRENNQTYNFHENCKLPQARESETYSSLTIFSSSFSLFPYVSVCSSDLSMVFHRFHHGSFRLVRRGYALEEGPPPEPLAPAKMARWSGWDWWIQRWTQQKEANGWLMDD